MADIGLDVEPARASWLVEDADVARLLPRRARDAPQVAVGGGGGGGLAGHDRRGRPVRRRGAYRAGAGMVRLGVPGGGPRRPDRPREAVGVRPAASRGGLGRRAGHGRSAAGPSSSARGSVAAPATVADVRGRRGRSTVPVVVDADGLFALGDGRRRSPPCRGGRRRPARRRAHPARRRVRPPGRRPARGGPHRRGRGPGARAAVPWSCSRVATTVVADPGGAVLLAAAGSPRLATAGTGDVLSGVIGAFLARGVEPAPAAAALAAHVHGRAAGARPARGLVAGDLADLLARWLSRAGGEPAAAHGGRRAAPASRPWAEIDVGAVRHNAALLRAAAAPAALCAVVKADGYGHGAVTVATAALEGGATWLAVATVGGGHRAARTAGIAAPVLVLSEPPARGHAPTVVGARPDADRVHAAAASRAVAEAARRAGRGTAVHVKVDTGMHRVGADPSSCSRSSPPWRREPVAALRGAVDPLPRGRRRACPRTGPSPTDQLDAWPRRGDALRAAGHPPPAAPRRQLRRRPGLPRGPPRPGAVRHRPVRRVRPSPTVDDVSPLWRPPAPTGCGPVMSLQRQVTLVRDARGRRASLLRATRPPRAARSTVATVPLGYADGVPRRYFTGGGRC